ncbi:acyltransferase [bacterium]|nr:acyltransferase [bacterium]
MGMLNQTDLSQLGFRRVGAGVRISDRASFHGAERISIGDGTRIDDFCVLSAGSGGITIGRNVHIAVYSSLIGESGIAIGDFSNISSRVSIYSSSDDYSGATMTNPTVPDRYKDVRHAEVSIGRHVIIGSGSVVLPGLDIGDGVAIGALSLVKSSCSPFGVYGGVPATRLKERQRGLLKLEEELLGDEQ